MVVNGKVKRAGDMKLRVNARELKRSIRQKQQHYWNRKRLHQKRQACWPQLSYTKKWRTFFVPLGLFFLFHCHIHTVFQMWIFISNVEIETLQQNCTKNHNCLLRNILYMASINSKSYWGFFGGSTAFQNGIRNKTVKNIVKVLKE